jgi:hypothetical protein
MNNTAIISTLAAIVAAAVVLIFTEGTLAAAAAAVTSPTPQPQNLICTHPANNATCSHEAIISTATQIPLPTSPQQPQPQAPAALAIIKHVIDDIVETISAKDFTSSASGTNVSPQSSFQGAQSPGTDTAVTPKPGTFPVALLQQANATTITAVAADHNKCSGGDIITCAYIKETHHPAKDTTMPFILPIPFP